MKFTAAFAALAVTIAVDAAATIGKRQSSECYSASLDLSVYERSFVYPLFEQCSNALSTEEAKQNPWVNKDCVAAAIVASLPDFHNALECVENSDSITLPDYSTWPSLDYNVYASIVGDCAWADGGCPVTMQNFVDLIYGSISTESKAVYPDSTTTLTKYYITPVFTWTSVSVDAGIPYTNFNDWLHHSGSVGHCVPGYPSGC
ncbi:hypothetical protein PENSPDRAFT_577960 [Peniophora sp. CONT]|nr:hypothetical protein PENSPDRAFT_577960 [Peniophora sp. CONT]